MIDVAIPGDKRMINKEKEKIEKCQNLKREINRLWNLKKIDAIPGLLGVLQRTSRNMQIRQGLRYLYCTKNHIIRDSKNIEKSARMLIKEKDQTRNLWLLVIASFLAKQRFNICLCCGKQIMMILTIIIIIIIIIIIKISRIFIKYYILARYILIQTALETSKISSNS